MPGLRYFTAFAWGFVLLASLAGWGLVVTRLLRLRDDWGQAIARGIAISVAVGGWLNLSRTISAWSVAGWIAAGAVLCVALGRSGRRRHAGRPLSIKPCW